MKKNLSLAGFSLVAMGLFMGSCVSKRKYMDAQASAAQRYSTDSAQWASRTNTMQQNITSLEQRSSDYQKQMDSFRTASANYQKRWDNLQSTYTQQNTSTEQLHQQIHTAIDQYVEASNVESRNGRIYVNLPEKMLFTSGSSTLSAKGKQALDKLADVLAANDNVEVDIVASAAYYNGGTGTAGMTSGTGNDNTSVNNNATDATRSSAGTTGRNNNINKDAAKSDNTSTARSNNNAQSGDTSTNPTASSSTAGRNNQSANVGDSAYPGSGTKTARTSKQDPNKKQSTAKSRTATTSTAKTSKSKSQGDRSVSFSSTPKSGSKSKSTASTAPSWNLNVARSTAIVRELTQNGLPQARIILTGQNSKGITTNEWASTNRGYQIVVSPKMDSYYQMMQEGQQGQGTTSMK